MHCSLTRVLTFHAMHRYHKPAWSEAENQRRFGWTSAAPGHGHLYRVEVTVAGPLDPETQMVIDLPLLDTILTETVAAPLAGRHLGTRCRHSPRAASCRRARRSRHGASVACHNVSPEE